MSFVKGTQIFTNNGWKKIEDIAGRDKVLVRNFLGDAEFIQPFALKKSQYDGEIVKIGAANWSFSVTPEHIVVYDRDDTPIGSHFNYVPAKDVTVHSNNRIYRKFKYMPPEEYKREKIVQYDEFGKHWLGISNEDWFVLMGYILCQGELKKQKNRKYSLYIYINSDKRDEEIRLLSDILDRIGVKWSLIKSEREVIRVSVKNSLANRVAVRLGSKTRKQMFLSDTMIYNSNKQLADMLIETIISASIRAKTERKKDYQFTTSNKKLVDSLVLLGTLQGYGMRPVIMAEEGTNTGYGMLKNDVHRLSIGELAKTYSPTKISRQNYSGYVYSIDLFDGQVYVREGSMPVWVNPK